MSTPSAVTPSHSRAASQHRRSRVTSATPTTSYLPQNPDELLYPEGTVTEDTLELLHEFVHPHRRHRTTSTGLGPIDLESSSDVDEDIEEEMEEAMRRPWHKRPSPWWLLVTMPFTAIAMSACAAPRVAIYTELACKVHRPDYSTGRTFVANANHTIPHPATVIGPSMSLGGLGFGRTASSAGIYITPLVLNTVGDVSYVMQDDAERQHQCATDPKVQAAVSKLIAVLSSVMGILSCMTTAWWGSLSDRYGRLRVMSVTVCGLLINDFNFIFVYYFTDRLPGGYWFLVVGPLIDGLFGGMSTGVAASHAYTADCTPPAARARIFSLSLGLLFIGMALGPTLGSFVTAGTGSPLTVFYVATAWHLFYSSLVWFVLPESLTRGAMMKSRRRRTVRLEEEEQERRERNMREGASGLSEGKRVIRAGGRMLKKAFAFMSPLAVFAPARHETTEKTGKMDWSLTFLAAGYGFYTLVMASYQFKFQYAAATFGWSAEELGYWLSLVGGARAIYLTLFLPAIIKFFNYSHSASLSKRPISLRASAVSASDSSSALLGPSSRSPSHSRSGSRSPTDGPPDKPRHSPLFNLNIARYSLALEIICYTLIPLAPTPVTFTLFSMLASCGGGFNPALQALALDLFSRSGETETGRLFGAMSVIQALSSQIIGPAVFGFTYVNTVSTYPKAIFFVSTAAVACSFVFLLFVRLPAEKGEYTHVRTEDEGDGEPTP